MLCYAMLYHIISYHIISYHIVSYRMVSYHIISYHILYYIILYYIILYYIILYYIILYYINKYRCYSCQFAAWYSKLYSVQCTPCSLGPQNINFRCKYRLSTLLYIRRDNGYLYWQKHVVVLDVWEYMLWLETAACYQSFTYSPTDVPVSCLKKTVLKFTLKQLRHVSMLQLHHHQGAY